MDTVRTILDLWSSYSLAARIVIFVTLAIVLFIWIVLLPWIQSGAANGSVQSEPPHQSKESTESELPSIRFGDTVDELRKINGVRELGNSENGLNLFQLPNGVLGWVEAYKLDSPSIWIRNAAFGSDYIVAESRTQLRMTKERSSDVEIHKAQDGVVRILAFVNESSRLQLQQPSRAASTQVLLAFREYEEYRFAVSIPRDRIEWLHHREFGDGEAVADARVS